MKDRKKKTLVERLGKTEELTRVGMCVRGQPEPGGGGLLRKVKRKATRREVKTHTHQKSAKRIRAIYAYLAPQVKIPIHSSSQQSERSGEGPERERRYAHIFF